MTEAVGLYTSPEGTSIYDEAADAYIELLEESNKAPRFDQIIDRLFTKNGKDWLDRPVLHSLLRRQAFQDVLVQKRKEYLAVTMAPRLLMGHLSAKLSAEAAQELLERLGDPDRREGLETKDLISLLKITAELAEKADAPTADNSQTQAVNKGTILNLFTQMSPERAAVVAQEIARQQLERDRGSSG